MQWLLQHDLAQRQRAHIHTYIPLHYTHITTVQWLLQHDPAQRPTSEELLRSGLVPMIMEDEYVGSASALVTFICVLCTLRTQI
jgi:hypothetical protein